MHAEVGGYAQIEIDGTTVGAVACEPDPAFPLIEVMRGRAPRRDDEIALGATTLRTLHRHLGDRIDVAIGGVRQPFRVVGEAVFPRFAPYPASEPTGLGVGAATTLEALRRFGPLDDPQRTPLSASPFILVDGPSPGLERRLRAVVLHGDENAGVVLGPQRPNDVASYADLRRTPLVLVGLLVLLAVGDARASARDRSPPAAEGPRRAARARLHGRPDAPLVLVQATTLVALALVVAVPIGVIAGRQLWAATAGWLGVPVVQVVPVGEVALVVVGAFVVGAIAALVPAIRAGRVDPAEILRSE